MTNATVLFDAACPPCRSLAELVAVRAQGLTCVSWQDFQSSSAALTALSADERARPADKLRVWTGTALLEGESAWEFLLERYRDLAALNWLAVKLGLKAETARGLARAGDVLRRLCWRCRQGLLLSKR